MASVQRRVRTGGREVWAVLYRHGGKQPSKTFDTEAAAEDFRDLVNRFGPERALKYHAEENNTERRGLTLNELYEKWIDDKVDEVTPRILTGYKRDYENWIKDRLGHREAAAIDEIDVQEWVDWMKVKPSKTTAKKLSPKSIADRHAILHQIFAWGSARTRRHVPHNPCKETTLPKRKKSDPKGLRLPELHALLSAGERIDQRDAADLTAFMAGTGWRISEAVAPVAGAFDDYGFDEDGRDLGLYVDMRQVLRREVGIVEDGKSAAAMRRLRVLGPAVTIVRRRLVGLGPNDFVFTFRDGRPGVNKVKPWNINSFRDLRWPKLVVAAGLADRKPTPHWLRHTHVAVCIKAGLSLPEIQRRLGHEDIQTTINIYGRMIDEMSDSAADTLGALLTPAAAATVSGTVVVGEIG